MSGCGLFGFDLLACGQSAFWAGFWWVADLLPWWGWLGVVVALGWLVYRMGGIPGLVAFAAGLGFLLGRRSARPPPAPPMPERNRRRLPAPTVRDKAADWFGRVTGRG